MEPGKKLAHYEVIKQLGVGGMGEVWLASDTKLDRQVALKILPENFTSNETHHLRFHREAQLLAAFSHPNVAGIYSLEEDGETHFLVMEVAEGEDLSDRLLHGALPMQSTLEIACQMAMAMEAAHQKGIIHRDLKPGNIKVDPDDQVKILDFGLAKVYADESDNGFSISIDDSPTITSSDLTRQGTIMGTAAYMSPEQARGKSVDKRSDIWAFGCVLYEMLTGKPVFKRETLSDTLAALLKSDPDWSALPRNTHPAVARLLYRCLEKNPRQRLHDVADIRIEIEDVLAGKDSNNSMEIFGVAVPADSRRKIPWQWITFAIVGWLAVLGMSAEIWFRPAEENQPVRLKTLSFSGRDWAPSGSPDGQTVAFASDRDGTPRIWLMQVASGTVAPLTEGPDDRPRLSPDGSQVLYVHDEDVGRSLFRQSLVGGQPRKVLSDVSEADWSPDMTQVVFLRVIPLNDNNSVEVGIADIHSGQERILTTIDNRLCYSVRWSPDGRFIALNETSLTGNAASSSSFDLIDTATGDLERHKITEWGGAFTSVAWAPSGKSLILGQTPDVLSYMSGVPGQVMEFNLETRTTHPLFWAPLRLPRGGWGYTTIAVLSKDRVVLDEYRQFAELHEIPCGDAGHKAPPIMLTASQAQDRQPVYSRDGKQVLFSSNRSGNIDLWIADRESGLLRQLTDDLANDWDPAFSPDGRYVIWSSDRSGHMEIWMANADGTNARQVSNDGVDAENPTMTHDGQWIIYASNNDTKRGIWKMRPDGTEGALLAPGDNLLPEASPTGNLAIYSMIISLDYVIKVVDIETGEILPFEIQLPLRSRHQDVVYGRARWSHDGNKILYIGQSDDGTSGVFAQDFIPDQDTHASRVPLAGFSRFYSTESLGVAPDGSNLTISARYDRRTLMVAEFLDLKGWE